MILDDHRVQKDLWVIGEQSVCNVVQFKANGADSSTQGEIYLYILEFAMSIAKYFVCL